MNLFSQLQSSAYRAVFRALARRRPPRRREIKLSAQSHVLIFTCAGIGDTLTDSVVFKALAETYPGIRLAGVVHHRRRMLLEHNPYCREIFTIRKGPFAFRHLHRELVNAGPWDAILHLRGNDPEPRCQSFLLDPDVTVSVPQMTSLGWLCGHHVLQPDWDDTHGVEQTLRIARYLGADTQEPTLVYRVDEIESFAMERMMPQLGIGPRPRLVLQIGGGRRAHWRDWPVARYAELIRLAHEQLDAEIIVLGGNDNVDRARELQSMLAGDRPVGTHILVGRFTLPQSAAMLASARAVVSTDTGIMHMAFAVGTRVVALIHCNNPAHRVGPCGYGDRHRVVQLERPPGYRQPGDANMNSISAATVLDAVKEIWS